MFDYYHYFVEKGNHPHKNDILSLEFQYTFQEMNKDIAQQIVDQMKEISKIYGKPIGGRIIYNGKILSQFLMDDLGESSLDWLSRKEKVCFETGHSSYYAFLDSMDNQDYDHMIFDETYGLCGGSFPLIIDKKMKGTITATGLRPQEDHEIVMKAIKSILGKE